MSQRQFEISAIPSHLKCLSNFQKWIYVGNLQDEAMLVGLIEYHIKVNQVQIIQSKLFESNQNNIAMQKINTLLNNSQNKSNRFTSFIEEVKIQDPSGQYFKDAIKSYLKYNYKSSLSEQVKFLCDIFKVQFVIIEQPNQQKLYGIETNGGINKIVLYKHQEQFYLILSLIELTCASCKTKLNLITLDCQHFICFYCLQKPFEQSKQLLSFTCNYFDCKQLVYRHFYLNLQKKLGKNEFQWELNEQNQKQLKIQNENSNIKFEIEYDPQDVLQKCIKCKKLFIQNQLIQGPCQHYYCKECVIGLCKFRNKFMCLECGFYIETDYIKFQIDKPNQNQDKKCCKCKQLLNGNLLFQNQCNDNICASCLETLAQQQTHLRCPQCCMSINIKDADKFLDKILTLKIEQSKNVEVQQQVQITKIQQIVQPKFLNQANQSELPQKSQQVLENPVFKVKQFEYQEFMEQEELQCAICGLNYRELEKQAQLQCMHVFHINCFLAEQKESDDCVLCQNIY